MGRGQSEKQGCSYPAFVKHLLCAKHKGPTHTPLPSTTGADATVTPLSRRGNRLSEVKCLLPKVTQ